MVAFAGGGSGGSRMKVSEAKVLVEPLVDLSCSTQPPTIS